MSKEKASIKETSSFVKETVQFRLGWEDSRRRFSDKWPLTGPSKWAFVLSTLKPETLKKWTQIVSSVNWGKHILNQVFPKSENPDEFHSRGGIVILDEHPVQVLGWKEKEELEEEGAREGLLKDWIDYGFVVQAEVRGIDLEWSFFQEPLIRTTETNDDMGLLGKV